MNITNDFEQDPFGDGYGKELEKKPVPERDLTCELGEECEGCGS